MGKALFTRWWPILVAVIALCWSTRWSWEHNAVFPAQDWHGDLRADAAGYYVYLPGAFHHGMRAEGWSSDITDLVGTTAFVLDVRNDRVLTKYTYGVALLQAPFYAIAELLTPAYARMDGFSPTHRRLIELAGCFYWVFGCVLLGAAIRRRWTTASWVPVATLLLVSLGSNVWFYAARMPGYSHVHSFFAVSLAVYALMRVLGDGGVWHRRLFHAACALILLIRPVDAIAVAGLYGWLFFDRPALLTNWRWWAGQVVIAGVLFAPQLLYWRFAYGSFITYTYGTEGFTKWASPELAKFVFAPMNGWVPNAPVLLLLPFGLVAVWRLQRRLALLLIAVLAVAIYACASWFTWSYGCAFGARPLVQYMPFVALAIAAFLARTDAPSVRLRTALLPLMATVVLVHHLAATRFDLCYQDGSCWDWSPYWRNLLEAVFGGHWNP